ncbi:MAG: hypothetical protein K2X97_14875 [Mycobacteriaceae bacterium]|nr:hypothetical protein [Mycobacteriaceae bacterium]
MAAVLLAVSALAGGAGVARAEPDDATPPIIDDLFILVPLLNIDPHDRDASQHGPGPRDWTGSGMFCQNRNAKCQKMGF